jgi:hypothetical protein
MSSLNLSDLHNPNKITAVLVYRPGSETIRQMPENYLVAHRQNGAWRSEPDLAADMELCMKVYRTINHSHANKYIATGEQIIEMAMKLT